MQDLVDVVENRLYLVLDCLRAEECLSVFVYLR